jgi:hypothetical protein
MSFWKCLIFEFSKSSWSRCTADACALVTAAAIAGELKIWNFNSGAVLREYRHREGRKEITAVAFLPSPSRLQEEEGEEEGEGQPFTDGSNGGLAGHAEGSRPGTGGGQAAGGSSENAGDSDEDEDEDGPPSLVGAVHATVLACFEDWMRGSSFAFCHVSADAAAAAAAGAAAACPSQVSQCGSAFCPQEQKGALEQEEPPSPYPSLHLSA